MEQTRRRFSLSRSAINLFFITLSIMMVLPMVLVVSISLSDQRDLLDFGYRFIPKSINLDAYRVLFEAPVILLRAYGITIAVTVLGTLGSLFIISITGYVLSRRGFRYGTILTILILFTMLFSGGLIPSYITNTQILHLKNNFLVLILPLMFNPFFILVMRGFMRTIPQELIDAAKIDGASEFYIYRKIAIPLSTAPLATFTVLLSFMYWNDWWLSLLYMDNPNMAPLQLMLWRMLNRIEFFAANPDVQLMLEVESAELPTLALRMAMVVIAAGPMMFIFPFFQRFFVAGLTIGALKN